MMCAYEVRAAQRPRPDRRKAIVLIAHDSERGSLLDILRPYVETLRQCRVIGTEATGRTCAAVLGIDVEILPSSVRGGDLVAAAMVVSGEIDCAVYLRNPVEPLELDPAYWTLARACDLQEIPFATNRAGAAAVVRLLLSAEGDDVHGDYNDQAGGPGASQQRPGSNSATGKPAAAHRADRPEAGGGRDSSSRHPSPMSILLGEIGAD